MWQGQIPVFRGGSKPEIDTLPITVPSLMLLSQNEQF